MEDRVLLIDGPELLSLELKDLTVLDRWPLGAPVSQTPVSLGTGVLILTDANELLYVAGTGADIDVRWRVKLGARPLAPARLQNGGVWLAFPDGRLVSRRPDDGAVLREASLGRAILDGPWVLGERLVLLAPDGGLAAFEPNESTTEAP
jgi:hypothetical protein